jgi:predicted PurR-regulated permease PerM
MTFSNNVLLPVLVGRAINVTPPTTMLAAIGGSAVGGIIGALFAMPVVGAIKAVYLDLRADQDRIDEEKAKGEQRARLGLVAMVRRRREKREERAAAAAAGTSA